MLRISSGGSAGFSTMTALPRAAPPTTSSALAVVSVNSSMFARVPGPADRDAIDDNDLGIVHRGDRSDGGHDRHGRLPTARHHVDVRRRSSASRLTTGTTYGPMAAGVRSIIRTPVAAACSVVPGAHRRSSHRRQPRCRRSSGIAQQALHAVGGGRHAHARARLRPSDVGSMPTIAAISQASGSPHHLDHQIGTDVARPDDGNRPPITHPSASRTWTRERSMPTRRGLAPPFRIGERNTTRRTGAALVLQQSTNTTPSSTFTSYPMRFRVAGNESALPVRMLNFAMCSGHSTMSPVM